jgi:hypothetical protein
MVELNGWELIALARYHSSLYWSIQRRIKEIKDKIYYAQNSENTEELRILSGYLESAKLDAKEHNDRAALLEELMDENTRDFYYSCC